MDATEARRAASGDPCSTSANADWLREARDKSTLHNVKYALGKEEINVPYHRVEASEDITPTFQETFSECIIGCSGVVIELLQGLFGIVA